MTAILFMKIRKSAVNESELGGWCGKTNTNITYWNLELAALIQTSVTSLVSESEGYKSHYKPKVAYQAGTLSV